MSMASYDTMAIHEDDHDDMYEDEHDHDHHPHNLSRLSICTTNSSKQSMYDDDVCDGDDMMMFMLGLSIDCDADEDEDEDFSDKEEVGSGGVSSDSDKEPSWMSLPGTPPTGRAHGGCVDKIIGHEKDYSSENEALKGSENKTKRNSRWRIVRERWLDKAWEEKRCKAKAMMDHEEDIMIMEHQNNHNNIYGSRRRSLCIDLEEVKACKDLGFELEIPSRISMSCSTLETTSSGGNSPIANWRISSPGDDPKDVKARLKVWAQAVAMASASRFLG